jgi:probable HAF family extracellular repeat protein
VGIPGDACGAQAINSSGQVIVACEHPTASARIPSTYRWQNGTFTRIDPPAGFETAGAGGQCLNNHGDVVGSATIQIPFKSHAFLCHNGSSKDLNDLIPSNSGWVLTSATAINDQGSIVGNGTINGNAHAFLLTPK